jgi:hypothetical protein
MLFMTSLNSCSAAASTLVVALTILSTFACVHSSFTSRTIHDKRSTPTNESTADWMANLPISVRTAALKHLIVPGSHDSATYTLDIAATPPMQGSIYQVLLDLLADPLTALIADAPIHDLTLTQRGMIAPFQLESGIRALDLRVLYNPANVQQSLDPFFFSHSFAAVPMNETLRGVASFLTAHAGEVIIVQLSVDWEHRNQTLPHLPTVMGIVRDILGEWLVPVPVENTSTYANFFVETSLATLVDAGHRVLFSLDETSVDVRSFPGIWNASAVNTFWPNGQTANMSMSTIDAYLYGADPSNTMPENNNDQLNLVFFTITPSDASIVQNVLDHIWNLTNVTSLRDYAQEMRAPTLSALAKAVGVDKKRISIVSIDWPDAEMISAIIALNK